LVAKLKTVSSFNFTESVVCSGNFGVERYELPISNDKVRNVMLFWF